MVTIIPNPICDNCGNDTTPILVDDGIGSSYYGDSYNFNKWQHIISFCCHSDVIEKNTSKKYTINDYNEWEFYQKF